MKEAGTKTGEKKMKRKKDKYEKRERKKTGNM